MSKRNLSKLVIPPIIKDTTTFDQTTKINFFKGCFVHYNIENDQIKN